MMSCPYENLLRNGTFPPVRKMVFLRKTKDTLYVAELTLVGVDGRGRRRWDVEEVVTHGVGGVLAIKPAMQIG